MPVGYMQGSKRARYSPSMCNRHQQCGGVSKSGTIGWRRVGRDGRSFNRASTTRQYMFCDSTYKNVTTKNPQGSGGVGRMFSSTL